MFHRSRPVPEPALKRILTTFILLISLAAGAASASAEPVQDFGVQLKDVTADGRYTIVFTSNSFDTTGDAPPAPRGGRRVRSISPATPM